MAIFHLHVKNISRGDGRSIVAAAAYRAGETLPNEAEERESAFGGRRDVVHTEIRVPAGAPVWMRDRAKLWNAVEAAEKRKDARLAKEIEFALPREVAPAIWRELTSTMADAYTRQGYVVDLAIHEDGSNNNPHAHMLLTTRRITAEGFAEKLREADGVRFVMEARARWAKIANASFAGAGLDTRIDARSKASSGLWPRASWALGA
ncbi:conjugal transfer protein, partial [Mesorhizobium sp. M00.F.Ca.ET.149.01.1.1]